MTEYISIGDDETLSAYIAASFAITSFTSQGSDGSASVNQGTPLTISGIAEATSGYDQPAADEYYPFASNEIPIAAGDPVKVFARAVSADGAYGPSMLLGTTTLVDTGTKDVNFNTEIYSWSLPNIETSDLPAGVYDIEVSTVVPTISENQPAVELADHPGFSYLTVTPPGTPNLPSPQYVGDSAEISRDGRYLLTSSSETDLQTGKVIALSSGEAPPLGQFASGQSLPFEYVNGNYVYIGINKSNQEVYDTYRFTTANGLYTFGAIGQDQPYDIPDAIDDIDYDTNGQQYDREIYSGYPGILEPVVTNNATGVTTLLPGYPGGSANGIPIGASDNGDVVLTQSWQLITGVVGSVYLSYLSAAPTLTLNPVNANLLPDFAGANPVTITGTSSALGQSVEIDVAAVSSTTVASEYGTGQMIGLATVDDNGTWSFTFDPASLPVTPSDDGLFFEASVSSADGTPARAGENVSVELTPPAPPTLYNNLTETTNQTSLEIDGALSSFEQNGTVLIYDRFNGANTLVATITANGEFFDTTVTGLAPGEHDFTAVAKDVIGNLSAPSQTITDIVDLTPPSEKVLSVTLNGGLPISLAQQKTDAPIVAHVVLDQPLAADDHIETNKGSIIGVASESPDGMSLDELITGLGAGGELTFSVSDAAGNLSPGVTASYTATSLRTITRISADPANPNAATGDAPMLSGDGALVAFIGENADGSNKGAYVAETATGDIVADLPGAVETSLSADGSHLSYVANDANTGARDLFVVNLSDPSLTPVLVATAPAGDSIDAPRFSGDGSQLVFESDASTLGGVTAPPGGDDNIFLAYDNGAGGYDLRAVTSDATGSSYDPVISEDGSTVAFESEARDLPGANPQDYPQAYVETLNGPDAGVVTLVDSQTTNGLAANYGASNPSVSSDGRYVVFESDSTNLAPVNLGAGQSLNGEMQVYVEDLDKRTLTLVSINALGAPGDGYSEAPVISADGTKVAFDTYASNLGSVGVVVADLKTGTLTVVSQPGAVASFADDASISADGSTVAFDSSSSAIVPDDTNNESDVFVTSSAPEGQGEDGYIAGASVGYLDLAAPAGVVRIDAGQQQTTTSAAGDFSLPAASDPTLPLVLTGGVDSATGLAFDAYLEAPAGSTVVTSLTTLIEKTTELTGDSRAAAETLVTAGLGLPAGMDLLNLDAFGGALGGASAATAALEVGAQALNLVELIVAAGGSATDAYNAIATALIAEPAGATLSLTDGPTVTSLAEAAHLSPALAETIASLVSQSAAELANALGSATTPEAIVTDVTADSIAEQGTAAGDLARDGTGATSDFDAASAFSAAHTQAQNNITNLESGEVACYARGARIATPRGDVAIEALSLGDLVVTASGALRPVRWLGWRTLDLTRHRDPEAVRPVFVSADAFGPGLPRRDLGLSPGHNVAFEGWLMPVSALVNGVSVRQVHVSEVEYWHVELDAHDVILAEGLPAESYLDTGNRAGFANGGGFTEAHLDFAPKHWAETCLPLVSQGPAVVAAKARLLARLRERGYGLDRQADAHVLVDGRRIEPLRVSETRLAFALPAGGREIVLASNTFVPAHTSADSLDQRELGLAVGRLRIDGETVSGDDDDAFGAGWHACEFEGGRFARRWTGGAARLPAGARIVTIDLVGAGHYWRASKEGALARCA